MPFQMKTTLVFLWDGVNTVIIPPNADRVAHLKPPPIQDLLVYVLRWVKDT